MVMLLLTLTACDPENVETSDGTTMTTVELLTRASLDLRGVRPSEAEIEQVEQTPDDVEGLIDTFLDDDRWPDRLVALYQEIYLSQTEKIDLRVSNIPFDDPYYFYWEMGQEPIRLLAEVAKEELPHTAIVTADWTMANEDIASFSPVTWDDSYTGWNKVEYTDGRPGAGVIATNGLWWRYTTTEANANRRRANALTRILVCEDYLQRPIEFDQSTNLLDEAAIADALHNNPTCVNCHVSLDPIASTLFGFYWTNFTSPTEGRYYHTGKEQTWKELTGVEPGWYGAPVTGLEELGEAVAGDPRFVTCAVKQAFELLLRRDAEVEDAQELSDLREDFLASDLRLKALFREIVNSPLYRAGPASEDELAVPVKMMTPDVLSSAVESVTGYKWTRDGLDVMQTDLSGIRALAGGVEGVLVKLPASQPDATVVLSQEALATEAAAYAVAVESAQDASERLLFTEIDFTETPDTNLAAMQDQLVALHLRVLSKRVDPEGQEVEGDLELWKALYQVEGDVGMAWQGVLTALLRDPNFLLY